MKIYQTKTEALLASTKYGGGVYQFSEGEWKRPEYSARKLRGRNGYYVYVRYFFCGRKALKKSGAI